ncbi:MAG: aminotransferase [Planctomycetota bacterium]
MSPTRLQADTLDALRKADASHHLHPFTHHRQMHEEGTHVITGGEGCYIFDGEGRRILDGIAGLWCVNVGYSCPEIADAVEAQMRELPYYCSFFNSTTRPAIELAEKLASLAPDGMGNVFFTNSGSESNETAMKIARGYHVARGNPNKTKFIARTFAYHGVGLASTSLTGLESCLDPFGLPLPGFLHVPTPHPYEDPDPARRAMSRADHAEWCLAETEALIEREGPDTIAALFAEPIQGAGGVIVPPEGYLAKLRALCKRYDILFVADEVITAFGRVGAWFASELWNLEPDLISTAKGLSSGYLPIGAVFVRDCIAEAMHEAGYLAHGFTYSGHPATCAAALANLGVLERDGVIPRVADDVGPYFEAKLAEFDGHPAVGETRGFRLLGAIEIVDPHGRVEGPLGPWCSDRVRAAGVVVRGIRNLIALSPPLIITREEIDELFAAVRGVLDELA